MTCVRDCSRVSSRPPEPGTTAPGQDMLRTAVISGNVDVAQLLLRARVDATAHGRNPEEVPLLLVAVRQEKCCMAELLMKACADGSLVLACEHGHAQLAESLMLAGADQDGQWAYAGNLTPLLSAARNGHQDVVGLLLQHRADPNKAIVLWGSPLANACSNGNLGLVRLLMEAAALVDEASCGPSGEARMTPLAAAASKGHLELARLLLEARAAIDTPVGEADANEKEAVTMVAPLTAAMEGNHANMVSLLLQAGAQAVGCKESPSLWACRHGHLEILRLLIAAGLDVNEAMPHPETCPKIGTKRNPVECPVEVL